MVDIDRYKRDARTHIPGAIGQRLVYSLCDEVEMLREANGKLLEACKAVYDRLDYIQNLWGKEGVTNSQVQILRDAITEAEQLEPTR